jgi:replicative DNA helicase
MDEPPTEGFEQVAYSSTRKVFDLLRKMMGGMMPGDLQTRDIPHSLEAEEAVLGAILIDPDSFYPVAQVLNDEDFYIHRHRFIWEAITSLQERSVPVDFLTLSEELDQAGKLAEIGGPAYLTELINQVPSSLHAKAYAQIIKQAAVRRRMLEAASKVTQLAYKEGTALEKMVNESEKAILAVSHQLPARSVQPFSQVLYSLYNQIEENSQRNDLSGIPTGFGELDRLLQGLQPSDLVIAAGRPGIGKTSFLVSVVRHAARVHQKHIVVFTLETSREQLTMRLLAQETGIEIPRIRSGKLGPDELQSLAQVIEHQKELHLFLDDTPAISVHQLRSVCRQLHLENKLDLVVVDYLQLIVGGERFENRVQEVSFVTRQLKALASELNVPVLAAAQLSRAVEQRADKRPLLSDLRESGSIEMDADVVLFIYHPEDFEASNQVDIIVAKQRNGPTGTARLEFQRSLAMFSNMHNRGEN